MAPGQVTINGYLYDAVGNAVGVASGVGRDDVAFPVTDVVLESKIYRLASFDSVTGSAIYLEVGDVVVLSSGAAEAKVKTRRKKFSRSSIPDTLREMVEGDA